jgi:mono/diheme cytochrome c family protein
MRRLGWLFLAACSSGTTTEIVHGTALDHGRALFSDPQASNAVANPFSCATCHPGGDAPGRVFPGGSLAGVTTRTTFWGGQRNDLLEAVNDCRLSFMDAPAPWTTDDEDAKAMYAYLASLTGPPTPIAFTPVPKAPDLPAGDPAQGKTLFEVTCRPCHGALHSGDGRLGTFIPRLPDDVDAAHTTLAIGDRRLVYLRKIREGAFRDGAGSMPPFAREALSDAEVGSVLAFLGQY